MSGYCKYYKQKKQVSYDNGLTWQDVYPAEYQRGNLYESDSADCGYIIMYRWVNLDPSIDYYCDTTIHAKYYKQRQQVSYDNGSTWSNLDNYQRGGMYESNSVDCGYEPIPYGTKFYATYSNGRTYSIDCYEGSFSLYTGDTKPSDYQHYYMRMTTAVIGNCVTIIEAETFQDCSDLISVTIPNSVTRIRDYAFNRCYSLTSVTIPNSVTYIGEFVFNYCSGLTSVSIGSSVTEIGADAFAVCRSLSSVTIPDSVTTIGNTAFGYCSGLISVNIGSGITSISNAAFKGCISLTNITIPSSVTTIGDHAFQGCSGLTSVTIPNSVTTIGDAAFQDCSGLTSVTIPDSVTTIGGGAFGYCSGLTSVTIPSSVTYIGQYAFVNRDPYPITITCLATTPPTLGEYAFGNEKPYNPDKPIYVPAASVEAYKASFFWSRYSHRIQAIP